MNLTFDDSLLRLFLATYRNDALDAYGMCQLLGAISVPDADRVRKVLYKEGKSDISSLLSFRKCVRAIRSDLAVNQLDVEEYYSSRMQDPSDGSILGWDLDYPSMATELSGELEALRAEKQNLSQVDIYETTPEMERESRSLDERIAAVRRRLDDVQGVLDAIENNDRIGELKKRYEDILERVGRVSDAIDRYMHDSSLSPMLDSLDRNLYFADIIDVMYALFRDLFAPGLSKVDLLEMMSLRRKMEEAPSRCAVPFSVLLNAIQRYYLAGNEDMAGWDTCAAACFGVKPSIYRAHKSDYGKDGNGPLAEDKKKLVKTFIEYVKALNELKRDIIGDD